MTPLPSGIGDDAFVENLPQQGTVRIAVKMAARYPGTAKSG